MSKKLLAKSWLVLLGLAGIVGFITALFQMFGCWAILWMTAYMACLWMTLWSINKTYEPLPAADERTK